MSRHRTWLVLAAAALLLPGRRRHGGPRPGDAPGAAGLRQRPPGRGGLGPGRLHAGQHRPAVPGHGPGPDRPRADLRVVAAPATGTVLSPCWTATSTRSGWWRRSASAWRRASATRPTSTGPPSETRMTRVDSAPPVVAVQINGGAPFTNDPRVSLDVSAYDPAAAGRPASGVRTLAVSQAGRVLVLGARRARLPAALRPARAHHPRPRPRRAAHGGRLRARRRDDRRLRAALAGRQRLGARLGDGAARPPRPDAAGGPGGAERPPGRAARDRRAPQRRRHRRHRRQRPRRLRLLVELRRRLGGPRAAGRPRLRPPGHLQGDARPGRPRRQRRRGRVHGLRRRPHGHRGPRRRAACSRPPGRRPCAPGAPSAWGGGPTRRRASTTCSSTGRAWSTGRSGAGRCSRPSPARPPRSFPGACSAWARTTWSSGAGWGADHARPTHRGPGS